MQKERSAENCVPVIFLTHKALEKNVRSALREIEKIEFIKKPTHVIRITGQTY
jgi:homoserine dehydrogenase